MTNFPIVKEGWPFIGIMAFATVLTADWADFRWALIPGTVTGFFFYFFRNPRRRIEKNDAHFLSPADGKVMGVVEVPYDEFLGEPGIKVTIFLSPLDAHLNRSPIQGIIKYQQYVCGRFRPAYQAIAAWENERHVIGIETDKCRILVAQIAGIMARRIVSWVTLGAELSQGQLYGMIKFGSCTEITVPRRAEILVVKGCRVRAGETIIGRLSE